MHHLIVENLSYPARGTFRISRSALTAFDLVQVTIRDGRFLGRGECRPYVRYGETPASVTAEVEAVRREIEKGIAPQDLQVLMPAGAARNAVDCALWDLAAKKSQTPVWKLLGLPQPRLRETAFTLSMGSPVAMASAARAASTYPVLKMKTGSEDGRACIDAVLTARPDARLIIDANEAMTAAELTSLQAALTAERVLMIEQPLPADADHIYDAALNPPICADEALHTRADLDALWEAGYRAVNVKLDKCGGLTEGLALMQAAKEKGFLIMAGCMVSSSLSMAPMMMLESFADVIDLDGPLLLSRDIENGLKYEGATVYPPGQSLWG